MEVESILHMNSGEGENSYARNSILQAKVIAKVRPILEDTVRTHYNVLNTAFPKCFVIADFGCSSGPNTLLAISEILETVVRLCRETGKQLPDEYQVFLNDLPGNDFNSVFKFVPSFYEELKEELRGVVGSCYISGVPGSFYTRLFPSKSIHFGHSSYSLHWLSQVPKGIENNKGNIYMAKTSPQNVFEAYLHQFQIDFSTFLCCRGVEIIPGGQMILTFIGKSTADPTKDCCYLWGLLTKSLLDMASEGLVREVDIDLFNLPYYTPYTEEVTTIVEKEGSFHLNKLEIFRSNWDPNDNSDDDEPLVVPLDKKKSKMRGENVAHVIRAISEPMLATHFGDAIIDDLFERYASHVAQHLSVEKTKYVNIVISLIKRKYLS